MRAGRTGRVGWTGRGVVPIRLDEGGGQGGKTGRHDVSRERPSSGLLRHDDLFPVLEWLTVSSVRSIEQNRSRDSHYVSRNQ